MKLNQWEMLLVEKLVRKHLAETASDSHYAASVRALLMKVETDSLVPSRKYPLTWSEAQKAKKQSA